jgi:transporter family-2 protein
MTAILWSLLGIGAGTLLALQAPINAGLARAIGNPLAAAMISFAVGTVFLGLLTAFTVKGQGVELLWRAPSWSLLLLGGLLGGTYVTIALMLTPKIGAAAMMAFLVTGQMLMGMVLDRIGFLDMAVREFTLGRMAGAVLLLAGALMIRLG